MEIAKQGRNANAVDVSTQVEHLTGAIHRGVIILPVIDWCIEVDSGIGQNQPLPGSVYDVVLPRGGHLEQVFQIFMYLKKYHNADLVYDPSDLVVNEHEFAQRDWTASEFGQLQGVEVMPTNMLEPQGMGCVMRAKVDADHTADTVTRRSRTGFLVYLNSGRVYWWTKKQTGIESSSFGSEFIAMKQCCKYIRGLRYKLRMMGIPVVGPAYIYGDNQSVLANTTIPDSTLKKKSQNIAYHFVHEGLA